MLSVVVDNEASPSIVVKDVLNNAMRSHSLQKVADKIVSLPSHRSRECRDVQLPIFAVKLLFYSIKDLSHILMSLFT